MNDLRQGVTPTQHEVLDLIERDVTEWPGDFEERLRLGRGKAADATRYSMLHAKRRAAIEAAAYLIDAADEIGRLIEARDGK